MTANAMTPDRAEAGLDSFDPAARGRALEWLAANVPPPRAAGAGLINMHIHSFFSYNSKGWSPSHAAWNAFKNGYSAAGLCDFDVLDGMPEFLAAAARLGLRAAVNVETRVHVAEYAHADINSPGEPGVSYFMGAGFAKAAAPGAGQDPARYRNMAAERNRALVARINARLPEIAIDYDRNVMPLSPGGCPTERHIVQSYRAAAEKSFGGAALCEFWARALNRAQPDVARVISDIPAIEELIRSGLVKRGGLGYEPPTPRSFPLLGEFVAWTRSFGAIPMVAWLDGTSAGESDIAALLEFMRAQGAAAINIIPDRNHNIKDPAARALKVGKLDEAIRAAQALDFPVNIGTEMNKDGQPLADDLEAAALKPHARAFLAGALIMVGHTTLLRFADYPYLGAAALAEFGGNIRKKNSFFEAVGALPPVTESIAGKLTQAGPEKALGLIVEAAARSAW